MESDLVSQFEVAGYPTILLIQNNQSYKFSGNRSLERIKEFAQTGYKNVTPTAVTAPKNFFQKIFSMLGKTFDGFAMMVDSIGLSSLPHWLKGTLPLLLLLSPIIGVILCFVCLAYEPEPTVGKDEEIKKSIVQTGGKAEAKPEKKEASPEKDKAKHE